MKKLYEWFKTAVVTPTLLLVGFLSTLAILPIACKSPPEVVAYKAVGTQVITVEAAKKAVADAYVAGQISEKDFQAIRVVSNQYDAAVKVEQSVVLAYKAGDPSGTNNLSRAMLAVTASSADLMALILQLLPQDRVAKLRGL